MIMCSKSFEDVNVISELWTLIYLYWVLFTDKVDWVIEENLDSNLH